MAAGPQVPVRALASGAAQVYREQTSPLGACGQHTLPVRLERPDGVAGKRILA